MECLTNKIVAVTGSEGFIAKHLINEIEKENPYRILKIDRKGGYDVTNFNQMADVLKGVDVVFDLATLPLPLSLRCPYPVCHDIYLMCINLCELCRQEVFKTLIHISSSEVYGTAQYVPMDEKHPLGATTPYAGAKAAADLVLQSYYKTFLIDCAIARPFNNYGPGQPIELSGIIPSIIGRILRKEKLVLYGDGTQSRDFLYVKDTVRGIIDIYKHIETRGLAINLATGITTQVRELVKLISELMDVKVIPVYGTNRLGEVQKLQGNATLAKKLIGFQPTVSLKEGLEETIKWYSSHT